jgi:hypothetical protein
MPSAAGRKQNSDSPEPVTRYLGTSRIAVNGCVYGMKLAIQELRPGASWQKRPCSATSQHVQFELCTCTELGPYFLREAIAGGRPATVTSENVKPAIFWIVTKRMRIAIDHRPKLARIIKSALDESRTTGDGRPSILRGAGINRRNILF